MMPASHTRERRRWRAIHSAFAVAMILSLIALAASVLPALAGFQPQQAFPVGELPYAVVAEDFNGDGRPDLATTDYHYNTVSVLLNTTTPRATVPTFADQQTFPTGSRPRGIAAADFNGDGKPDLATANSGATTVSVLLNITMPGASVPTFATQQAFNVGSPPAFLAAADFNGDGKPDIVAGNGSSPGTVSVLLGIGDGTLGAPTPLLAGSAPRFVAVGDLNGDGRPDVAAANYGGSTVSLFLGNGDGTFQPVQTVTVFNRPNAVAVADLNGDGKSDLAVTNHESQVVSVHFNTTMPGAATLTFAPPGQYATRGMPQSMLIADLNGDGKPDLTMANFGHADVGVYFNTTEIGAAVPSFTAQQSFLARFSPISPVAADLNGDGRLDLAVANNNDRSVSVLLGNPSGTLQFNSADLTVTEGAGSATITLTRTGSTDGQVSAIVSLTGGSATQGQDFIFASPQTVTWADGDGGNQTITIPIAQDTFVEGSETALFTLTLLANPFGATLGAKTTTALTIANTPKDGLSIENGDRSEGNAGTEQIPLFRVSLTPPHTQTVTVQYATSDGTATAGKDYVATSGTLTFAPGETTRFVTVQMFGDLLDEPDESFHVTLSNPTQASLGVAQATGKIHNDDSPGTCTPRPRINVQVAANGNALQVHVEPTPPHTGATNRLQQLRFGTLQNATVTLNGQPVTSGQSVLMPTNSQAADFVVTRVADGQPATVPLTVVDGCGEWQTFVGGGAGAGF